MFIFKKMNKNHYHKDVTLKRTTPKRSTAYRLAFFLLFFSIITPLHSAPDENPFKCNVIDFNGVNPGFGHFQPLQNNFLNYHNQLMDKSKQVTHFSGSDFYAVTAQCHQFAENNKQFMPQTGSCDVLDGDGEILAEGTWVAVPGNFIRKGGFGHVVFDAIYPASLSSAPWKMVYWQMARCTQNGTTGEPFPIYPLPFVIDFEQKDCEEGLPVDNGVDAFDGAVTKSISIQNIGQYAPLTNTGLLAKLGNNFPLDFVYSTDANSTKKTIQDVKTQWINANDSRVAPAGLSPFEDDAWETYNWIESDQTFVSI